MDPEEGVVLSGIQLMVEVAVVLVGQGGRLLGPGRFGNVDYLVAVGVDHLAVLPFLLLAGNDGDGEEAAVFFQKCVDAALFEELFVFLVDVEDYVGSALCFLGRLHCELRRAVAFPANRLGSFFIAERADFYL